MKPLCAAGLGRPAMIQSIAATADSAWLLAADSDGGITTSVQSFSEELP